MPEYLDDPSVLTKDKLKSELLANNVELPSGNPTKDVFVQLYLTNLTAQKKKNVTATTLDAFSSDEELPPPVVSSRSRSSGRVSLVVYLQINGDASFCLSKRAHRWRIDGSKLSNLTHWSTVVVRFNVPKNRNTRGCFKTTIPPLINFRVKDHMYLNQLKHVQSNNRCPSEVTRCFRLPKILAHVSVNLS